MSRPRVTRVSAPPESLVRAPPARRTCGGPVLTGNENGVTGRATTQGHYVSRWLDVFARAPRQTRIHGPAGSLDGAALVRSVHRAHEALRAAGAGPGTTVGILTGPNHP